MIIGVNGNDFKELPSPKKEAGQFLKKQTDILQLSNSTVSMVTQFVLYMDMGAIAPMSKSLCQG
jgi:hypothetical protein